MSKQRLDAYQIEVLEFPKNARKQQSSTAVIPDARGQYRCPRCNWEGEWVMVCPKCGSKELYPKSRVKLADTQTVGHRRTVMELFRDAKKAKKWGARFGTVISCRKIDKSYYLENIEHLNLRQEPLTIELEQDFVLNKALELERPKRNFGNRKLNVEIVEEVIDKE